MSEAREIRLKRLMMRSWRRGTKEMDLILGRFADSALQSLAPGDLDLYERLLEKNDQELYAWVSGRAHAPAALGGLVAQIARFTETTAATGGN